MSIILKNQINIPVKTKPIEKKRVLSLVKKWIYLKRFKNIYRQNLIQYKKISLKNKKNILILYNKKVKKIESINLHLNINKWEYYKRKNQNRLFEYSAIGLYIKLKIFELLLKVYKIYVLKSLSKKIEKWIYLKNQKYLKNIIKNVYKSIKNYIICKKKIEKKENYDKIWSEGSIITTIKPYNLYMETPWYVNNAGKYVHSIVLLNYYKFIENKEKKKLDIMKYLYMNKVIYIDFKVTKNNCFVSCSALNGKFLWGGTPKMLQFKKRDNMTKRLIWLLKIFVNAMYKRFLKPSNYRHLYIRFKNIRHKYVKSFMYYLESYKSIKLVCYEEKSAIGYNGVRPKKSKRR